VLRDEEDDNKLHHGLPHYFAPEPYLLSDPNIEGAPGAASLPADIPHPQTPASLTAALTPTRKRAVPAQLRPVNIIQHDDAGPSEGPESAGEPETIEVPPVYIHIHSVQRSPVLPLPQLLLRVWLHDTRFVATRYVQMTLDISISFEIWTPLPRNSILLSPPTFPSLGLPFIS
jgi:hypothetical protein